MPTVPKDHWESLQGTIEDLKTLSEIHEDSSIANVARKLYQLIDANLQVIEGKEVFYIACFELTRLFSYVLVYVLKGVHPIIFVSNIFPNSHLIQKFIQNQQLIQNNC